LTAAIRCGHASGVTLAVPDAVWSLLAVIVLVLMLALIFRRTIEQVLIPRVSGVKVLGLEISFAKEELGAASKRPELARAGAMPSKGDQRAALERAREAWQLLQGAGVLWVDDDPSGNRSEMRMLQAFGVMIDTVTTNDAGLKMLEQHYDQYDMVISDIERSEGPSGLALAQAIALSPHPKPLIFYVRTLEPGTPKFAFGITNRPDHLLHYVVDVVARWRRDAARG
jgi:CheY-like chemotaxis protein